MLRFKLDIGHAILLACWMYDVRIGRQCRELYVETVEDYNKLVDEFNALHEKHEKLRAQANYLVAALNRHEIEMDEFDEIALHNPFPEL